MSLTAGTRFGPYEIVAPIGAGGMGEVYKARDTRLDRTVAVKVLPSHIAAREDLRQRFEREARVVSSLNHPHICVLHDIGRENDIDYLIMEHLDGETLESRLARGPLPVDQALKYAEQIADAVDRAHRSGVVHRDLKPGNIMLTRDGVKVLDFGLAKTASKAAAVGETITAALTSEGTLLGTPQYMAPEQIEGREADARTDIFAFGCVLYEVVTGKRAFDGKTKASVVGAILGLEPPSMSTLQPVTPRQLERLVKRCLAKDPEERWQSMRDVLLELRTIEDTVEQPQVKSVVKPWGLWPAVTVLIAAAAAAAAWQLRPPGRTLSYRYTIGAPPEATYIHQVAVSPDGTMVAIAARSGGKTHIWLRRLDSLASRLLPGTEDGSSPFWSPDSQWIAFFAAGKLKKIPVSGGPAQTICDTGGFMFGWATWGTRDVILYSHPSGHIHQVPADGGTPQAISTPDKVEQDGGQFSPWFLPDGRHFLYTVRGGKKQAGVYLAELQAPGQPKLLVATISPAVYAPALTPKPFGRDSGHLLVRREGTLMAVPFDSTTHDLTGKALPVGEQVTVGVGPPFSVSTNGILTYQTAGAFNRLVWRDRTGRQVGVPGNAGAYGSPSLSPDGKRLVFNRLDVENWDIWMQDLSRATMARFTVDPGFDSFPIWSPAGDNVAYGGPDTIIQKSASGGGQQPVEKIGARRLYPSDWSADGQFLLAGARSGNDFVVIGLNGERKLIPLLTTPFTEMHARFSPSNAGPPRWFAYDSDESGMRQVYVQAFVPGRHASGERVQISTNGGSEPRWRGDGKQLFYLSADQRMMAVDVRSAGTNFEAGTPVALFETSAQPISQIGWSYDVTRDGQRFVLLEQASQVGEQPITVVINWQAGLKQ